MKTLYLLVFLSFLQASPPVPRQAADSGGRQQQAKNQNGNNKKPSTDALAGVPVSPKMANPKVAKQNDHDVIVEDPRQPISVNPVDVRKDVWDYLSIAASIVLTIITLILAIIAKLSADIAINAQRSWVVSTGVEKPDFTNPWVQHIACHFKVIGNRPIRVIESNFRVRLVPAKVTDEASDSRIPDLPEKPDYKNPATLEDSPEMGGIRPPEEEFSVIPMLESMFLMEGGGEDAGGPDVKAIRDRSKFLCAYGFIRYREAFSRSKLRETRFCYVYRVKKILQPKGVEDGWSVGGPPAYNEAT